MQLPTTIALAALGLVFITGEAGAYYHRDYEGSDSMRLRGVWTAPSYSEQRKARERREWVDRERARQENRAFNREQDRLLNESQRHIDFLNSLGKQGGLYEPSESLFGPPARRRY